MDGGGKRHASSAVQLGKGGAPSLNRQMVVKGFYKPFVEVKRQRSRALFSAPGLGVSIV
jgi:hypothetical protein